MSDGPTRLWARAQTLQLCAGLVDTFELRMSRPPYSLLKVTDAAVPLDEKIASIEEALAMPSHCRPWFLDRLLHLCPTVPSMLSKGQHVLRAWNEGCGVSIDCSERSHAQHRTDMKSNGRARSSTVASNRVFVQSVRADMIRRGMRDPGMPLLHYRRVLRQVLAAQLEAVKFQEHDSSSRSGLEGTLFSSF